MKGDDYLDSLQVKEKKMKNIYLNYFFLGTGLGLSLGLFFSLFDMSLFASWHFKVINNLFFRILTYL